MGTFANILASIKTAIPVELAGGAINIYAPEQKEQFGSSSPPAIAMELVEDVYAGTRQGGKSADQVSSLATAETTVRFHCWGKSIDDTHELRRMLIAALHKVAHGSYRLSSGAWSTDGVTRKGAVYNFTVALQIPITRDRNDGYVVTQIEEFEPVSQEIQDILET